MFFLLQARRTLRCRRERRRLYRTAAGRRRVPVRAGRPGRRLLEPARHLAPWWRNHTRIIQLTKHLTTHHRHSHMAIRHATIIPIRMDIVHRPHLIRRSITRHLRYVTYAYTDEYYIYIVSEYSVILTRES